MRFLLLLALAMVFAGCKPDLPPIPQKTAPQTTTAEAAPAPTAGTTQPSTTASKTEATPPAKTNETKIAAAPEPGKQSTAAKAPENPRRIHQLSDLEHGTVVANGKSIEAWLMDDESKQQEGMMWLTEKDVKDNQGMLFVFASAQPQSFWMQNTLIPLDIIYIDANGKVLNIVHGKPRDETPLPSKGPAKYVLELKDGMAAKFGIAPGAKVTIPKNATYKGEPSQPGGLSFGGG